MKVGELALRVSVVAASDGDGPGVALGSEDGRAGGVERAESVQERRVLFGLRKVIEVVGVIAQIDEMDGGVVRVGPGDDEKGVVGATFGGPVRMHDYY